MSMIGFTLVTRISLGLSSLELQTKSLACPHWPSAGASIWRGGGVEGWVSKGCPRSAHKQACGPARTVLAAHVDNPCPPNPQAAMAPLVFCFQRSLLPAQDQNNSRMKELIFHFRRMPPLCREKQACGCFRPCI